MAIFPKVNGVHKEMTDCKVKVNGEWKQALEVLVKVNGKWKQVWNNVAIYIVSDTSYEIFELPFDNVKDIFIIENLVVQVYDRNNRLIATMVLERESTSSGSYSVYDNKGSYGEIGIRTDENNNKLIFSININYETDARKFIVTADKVNFDN
jgi:hypothetical protein